ncbi:MAG: hypothetical protein IPF82_16405 [Blastocatellia bacterium]|nr:hypothetical protein [Blastocatellia bacterium]
MKWAVARIHADLVAVAPEDAIARDLARTAVALIEQLRDVSPAAPRREELLAFGGGSRFIEEAARRGIEALGWVVDERGLGGGRELDGLAWQLPLDRLWEAYVESVMRREAALTGADVRVARLGQTTFPLNWTNALHRTLGHLAPDIVVRRGRRVRVVDAKYKAHLAELDESSWRRFADELKERHRADLHQVLAYAALYDADEITATLVYPLRYCTWKRMNENGDVSSVAELSTGGRSLRLELLGLPFGRPDNLPTCE